MPKGTSPFAPGSGYSLDKALKEVTSVLFEEEEEGPKVKTETLLIADFSWS
jgi:hypothetical protein